MPPLSWGQNINWGLIQDFNLGSLDLGFAHTMYPSPKRYILKYFSLFRERLHKACNFVCDASTNAKSNVKINLNKMPVGWTLQSCDH